VVFQVLAVQAEQMVALQAALDLVEEAVAAVELNLDLL
jgi:hypothetical protein